MHSARLQPPGSTEHWADPRRARAAGALEVVDRRGTDPSSAAGHQDTFLHSSRCCCGRCHHRKCRAATCTNMRSRHCQQLLLRETPPVAGPLDPQGTDRDGQSAEDGHVWKRLALVSVKSTGMKYFQFWPQRGHSRFAEQCQGLHREIPRGSRVGSEKSISRQQVQAKRERKR